jgi:hypothetical protein
MISWEVLKSNDHISVFRARVPGGWLVYVGWSQGGGVTFYPDPTHSWNGKSIEK